MGNIGIYIELKNGNYKKSNQEALGLAKQSGMKVYGVIFTQNIEPYREHLRGLDHLIQVKAEDLNYQPDIYAQTIADLIQEFDLQYFTGIFSAQGRELFPRISAKLDDSALVNDCIAVNFGSDTVTKPVYAGKLHSEIMMKSDRKIFTLRPNIFPPIEGANGDFAVKEHAPATPDVKTRVVKTIKSEVSKIDLSEAEIIVSGGRGMKDKENFKILDELASLLNAAVGASRAAVDSGYASHDMQVGQTGKVVNPKLYIACGISGAIQHLVGMKTSKVIVAINKDPEAPIFKKADYGIVGDLFTVVPLLTEKIKSLN
jgi:electron transfer flavoprotein alpha subunit